MWGSNNQSAPSVAEPMHLLQSTNIHVNQNELQFYSGQEVFLFSKGRRPDVQHNQPRIKWVPVEWGGISSGIRLTGRKADHSRPSSAKVTKAWSYRSTPPYTFTECTGTPLLLHKRLGIELTEWISHNHKFVTRSHHITDMLFCT